MTQVVKEIFDVLVERKQKGSRWMPWLYEAMKDVISCDKLR